jgi:hypothetical protein
VVGSCSVLVSLGWGWVCVWVGVSSGSGCVGSGWVEPWSSRGRGRFVVVLGSGRCWGRFGFRLVWVGVGLG